MVFGLGEDMMEKKLVWVLVVVAHVMSILLISVEREGFVLTGGSGEDIHIESFWCLKVADLN